MRSTLILATTTIALLSGCTTVDPLTGQNKTTNTTKGALIGTAGGALAGALIGGAGKSGKEARKGALIGAGLGLLAGGSVGLYMDQQEAELRRKLEGTGVQVARNGDQITLLLPSNITFASGQDTLNPAFFNTLGGVATVLQQYPKTIVDIIGHTDSDGDEASNVDLSQRRAISVGNYIAGQGVDARRLLITGMGETRPVASNETEEGKSQNRRVEIVIQPLK